jgi:hypothetical protein
MMNLILIALGAYFSLSLLYFLFTFKVNIPYLVSDCETIICKIVSTTWFVFFSLIMGGFLTINMAYRKVKRGVSIIRALRKIRKDFKDLNDNI